MDSGCLLFTGVLQKCLISGMTQYQFLGSTVEYITHTWVESKIRESQANLRDFREGSVYFHLRGLVRESFVQKRAINLGPQNECVYACMGETTSG